jgi:hypothetical protein
VIAQPPAPRSRRIVPAARLAAPAFLAASLLLACGPPADDVVTARLAAYFDAVQAEDVPRIASLLASCVGRAAGEEGACEGEVARQLADVAGQRERGDYRFEDPWGLGLIRAFVLGRGGYWTVARLEVAGDRAALVLELRTQYRPGETRGLPHDAVIEYLGRPLGRVEKVPRGGAGPGSLRWQLQELSVEARLRRVAGRSGEPEWRVESLRPLRETARFEQVTWRPR